MQVMLLARLKLGSLFDGIGGFPLAAVRNGIEPVWASEIERVPIEITKKHFPNMVHLGDITQINGAEIEPVDIITAGSPCQDLSVAGKRAGLEGERSGLFMDFIRIVREMREATNGAYPKFIIWENVPGAFSSNRGQDFRAVLEEIMEAEIPMPYSGKWATSGMVRGNGRSLAWRVLDAQYWGVPQRRKRIFLVADFTGGSAAEILFEQEGVCGDFAESREAWQEVAATIRNGIEGTSPVYGLDQQGGKGQASYTENVSPTILSDSHGTPHAVAAPILSGSDGGGGRAGRGYVAQPLPFDTTQITSKQNGSKPSSTTYVVEPRSHDEVPRVHVNGICPTLNTAQGGQRQPCVVQSYRMRAFGDYTGDDTASALKARDYKDATDLVCQTKVVLNDQGGQSINSQNPVRVGYAVRRLTPTECERLMGFPDDWTVGHSDTARYKALGNSLAVPCVMFILSRLTEVVQERA